MNRTTQNRSAFRPRRVLKVRLRLLRRRWNTTSVAAKCWGLTAVAVAALAVVAALMVIPSSPVADPVAQVQDYLSAVKRGDVARALRLADERPTGEAARFLAKTALDGGWELISATDVTAGGDRDAGRATVEVVVEDDTGRSSSRFPLTLKRDGGWHLDDPFVEVRFARSPLRFIDVNGQNETADFDTPDQGYLLFPGSYSFYSGIGDIVDTAVVSTLLLPGDADDSAKLPHGTVAPALDGLTADGLQSAQLAVDEYIDDCARSTKTRVEHCPFSAAYKLGELLGYEYMRDYSDVEWKVVDYPQISLAADKTAFAVTDEKAGEITLTATGTEQEWSSSAEDFVATGEHDIEVTCQIQARWLRLALAGDGTWQVTYYADPGKEPSIMDYRPGMTVQTCA